MDRFFSFLTRSKSRDEENQKDYKSIAIDQHDGSIVETIGEGTIGDSMGWSTSFDINTSIISENDLISRYRHASLNDVLDKAIDIIVNEMVSTSADTVVSIDLDKVEYSDAIKNKIVEEFDHVLRVMDFNNECYEIVRRWYIDGRLQYQVVIDKEKYKEEGIGKITYLDPTHLKKVALKHKTKDTETGVELYQDKGFYYIYSQSAFDTNLNNMTNWAAGGSSSIKITEDGIVQVTSGILDPTGTIILSHLHKALRPLNQLRGLEDATMIYKISRAPERRVFYIDVGNLPPSKAEEALRRMVNQYKTKNVYDASTGMVKTDPKQMIMTEDFYLPRRSDGKATEITTLPSGQLSGDMGELNWFLNKLYNSLNIPISRMDTTTGFSLGRTTEITRDEVALTKFIARLRRRFCSIFLDLLKRQLALKNIINNEEFDRIRQDINFQFESDNHFDELLSLEVLESKMNVADRMIAHTYNPQIGLDPLFSVEFIYKNIMFFTDEEIAELKEQKAEDIKNAKKFAKDNATEGDEDESEDDRIEQVKSPTRVIHQADKGAIAMKQNNKAINSSKQQVEIEPKDTQQNNEE